MACKHCIVDYLSEKCGMCEETPMDSRWSTQQEQVGVLVCCRLSRWHSLRLLPVSLRLVRACMGGCRCSVKLMKGCVRRRWHSAHSVHEAQQ